MSKDRLSENEVKKVLNIDSFRNLSKDKIMEFVSIIPNLDKDVAIKIIEQFPNYAEYSKSIVNELKGMVNNAMEENTASNMESIKAYNKILDELSILLQKENISPEERKRITEDMILVADKISEKDTENKHFLNNILVKGALPLAGLVILVGASLLGGNSNIKLPNIKS